MICFEKYDLGILDGYYLRILYILYFLIRRIFKV